MAERKDEKPAPPTAEEYAKAKIDMALSYAPAIKRCGDCGWPVLVGYCCNYCGSNSP